MMLDCLLCLEKNVDIRKSIELNSTHLDLNVKEVIEQHLWPIEVEDITSYSCVCNICWKELESFHTFYMRLKNAHDVFKLELKTETDPLKEDLEDVKSWFVLETPLEPDVIKLKTIEMKPENEFSPCKNDSKERYKSESEYDGDSFDDSDNDELNKCTSKTKERPCNDKVDTDVKNNIQRKIYYHPKTDRGDYDEFLRNHFKISCNLCEHTSESFRLLCQHYNSEHNEQGYVICCKMKFFQRRLLVDHIKYHLNPDHFKCEQCEKVFNKRRCLTAHMRLHEEMEYCCDVCDKQFVEKYKLERHKLTHLSEEEKKYPCNECGKYFGTEKILIYHQRAVHLNTYAKVCEICGIIITDTNSFKRHMEKHNPSTQTETFKCDECGLLLSLKVTLKNHKKLKHPVGGSKDHKCHLCPKVSPNLKALKKHIQCAHEMGYDYKCTVCEKAFKRADNLKAHMSMHTGTPLYRCPWCPKEFFSNGNMHGHRKKAHPIEWEEAQRKKYSGNLPTSLKTSLNYARR